MKQERPTYARAGIVLLNLLAPGLGLLRLGRWRTALSLFGASAIFLGFMNFAPPMSFALLATLYGIGLSLYPIAFWLSWRSSRTRPETWPWYAHWYSVVGAMLLAFGVSFAMTDPEHLRYRAFYVPSEGMEPTLEKNDNFFAFMRTPSNLKRGDVVLVRVPGGSLYVKRIAALPGDRIEVRKGIVLINGEPVPQKLLRTEEVDFMLAPDNARRLRERFPGEIGDHEIYDLGASPGDDFGPELVRPGHVFLLGDNRDRSADSRFRHDMYGLEQVPVTSIAGRPLYFSWRASRPLGTPITKLD